MRGLVGACAPIAERLLEGTPEEVTQDVWKAVMSMLRQLSDHTIASVADVELIVPLIRRGLTEESRSVRLDAGYVALVLLYLKLV